MIKLESGVFAEAESFDQLHSSIESEVQKSGNIVGTIAEYSASDLKYIIDGVRRGEFEPDVITRTEGLRDKVLALLDSEKQDVDMNIGHEAAQYQDARANLGMDAETPPITASIEALEAEAAGLESTRVELAPEIVEPPKSEEEDRLKAEVPTVTTPETKNESATISETETPEAEVVEALAKTEEIEAEPVKAEEVIPEAIPEPTSEIQAEVSSASEPELESVPVSEKITAKIPVRQEAAESVFDLMSIENQEDAQLAKVEYAKSLREVRDSVETLRRTLVRNSSCFDERSVGTTARILGMLEEDIDGTQTDISFVTHLATETTRALRALEAPYRGGIPEVDTLRGIQRAYEDAGESIRSLRRFLTRLDNDHDLAGVKENMKRLSQLTASFEDEIDVYRKKIGLAEQYYGSRYSRY